MRKLLVQISTYYHNASFNLPLKKKVYKRRTLLTTKGLKNSKLQKLWKLIGIMMIKKFDWALKWRLQIDKILVVWCIFWWRSFDCIISIYHLICMIIIAINEIVAFLEYAYATIIPFLSPDYIKGCMMQYVWARWIT